MMNLEIEAEQGQDRGTEILMVTETFTSCREFEGWRPILMSTKSPLSGGLTTSLGASSQASGLSPLRTVKHELSGIMCPKKGCQPTLEMSGLCDSRCCVLFAFRQQPCAPRIILQRLLLKCRALQ